MVEDVDGILASDSEQNQQSRDALLEGLIGQATPISDVRAGLEYRAAMLGVMSRRTLKIATSRLRQAQAGA
jgi:hypothetical protein